MGLVRAQGLPQETVLYGLEEEGDEEGAFEIDASSGEIRVGPNGPDLLVIVRTIVQAYVALALVASRSQARESMAPRGHIIQLASLAN